MVASSFLAARMFFLSPTGLNHREGYQQKWSIFDLTMLTNGLLVFSHMPRMTQPAHQSHSHALFSHLNLSFANSNRNPLA